MTGEPRDSMERHPRDRLPPIVTSHHLASSPDTSLAGAPLPPYWPGLYTGFFARPEPGQHPSPWTKPDESLSAEERTGHEVSEGWPDAWRDDPDTIAEPVAAQQQEADAQAEDPSEMLVLDEAEVQQRELVEDAEFQWTAQDSDGEAELQRAEPETDGASELQWTESETDGVAELQRTESDADGEAELQGTEPEAQPAEPDVEAEVHAAEPERDPTGYEQAADDLTGWQAPTLASADADLSPWGAWDADEAAVYDLPGAAGEDTGPWQNSWAEPLEIEGQPIEPVEAADAGDLEATAVEGPEPAEDVQDWLEAGAVESIGWDAGEVSAAATEEAVEGIGWDAGEVSAAATEESVEGVGWDAGEVSAAATEEELPVDAEPQTRGSDQLLPGAAAEPLDAFTAESAVQEAGEGEETGELIEMVEEPGPGETLEFAPADEQEGKAPAELAWAPFEARDEPAEAVSAEVEDAGVAAAPAMDTEQEDDERVAILPATPLDSWYHVDRADEADATWEAFGRALEEAASWGDLDVTIATGLPPEEARGEAQPRAAASAADEIVESVGETVPEPAGELAEPMAEAAAHAGETADPAVTDLARRLEQLAQRLRQEGEKGVEHAMAEGDRLEASLAGFIAGYVAARRG